MKRIPHIDQRLVEDICRQLGITHWDSGPKAGQRFDAGETAFVSRQLEYVLTQVFETKYPALLARRFIPINNTIPTGAETWSYNMWDEFGIAKIIHSYADDLPMVGRFATRTVAAIKSLGDAYGWSIQDIRNAMQAGVPLQADLATTARRVAETKVDEILAVGASANNLVGMLNHPNVTLATLPNGSWSTASAAEILEDLHYLVNQIRVSTKQIFAPDTFLFDQTSWGIVTTKPVSELQPTMTVLRAFLDTSPYIRNADVWWRLDTADAGGTGPRLVCYARSPEVVEGIVPQEFEQFPPQAKNLSFMVPCHMRCGGVSMKYPLAMQYADNHL